LFHWYALRVRSRCEKAVASFAQSKGFEQFLPQLVKRNLWSDRIKTVRLPLFAGYVFCRFDPSDRLPILAMPGVLHIVGLGKIPMAIEDSEINAIRTALQSDVVLEPCPYIDSGPRVQLLSGPLMGVEGYLIEAGRYQRMVVSVNLLQRSVALEIDPSWMNHSEAPGLVGTFSEAPNL